MKPSGVLLIKSIFNYYDSSILFRFHSNLGILLSVWVIHFPHVFRKLYAEDGVIILQGTFERDYFREFLDPVGGFSQLVARIGGQFMRRFPIEFAAVSAAIFTAVCISFLSSAIYEFSRNVIDNPTYRAMASLFFLFIPIANFNSVGTICNLYFYLMSAAAILVFSPRENSQMKTWKNTIILLATLTNPLCIFLALLISGRIFMDKSIRLRTRVIASDFTWLIGMTLQFAFIFFFSWGKRLPHPPESWLSIVYLTLDRGFGSALVPNWGFVSGDSSEPKFENTILMRNLQIRLIILLALIVLIFSLMVYFARINENRTFLRAGMFIFTAMTFSILVGIGFSVEPRYMIFTSFLVFYAICILLSRLGSPLITRISLIWFTCLLMFSLTPSSYISQGPNWKEELDREQRACELDYNKIWAEIRIMPNSGFWLVKIPCSEIIDR